MTGKEAMLIEAITNEAFSIPAPNPHTPIIVQLAQELRRELTIEEAPQDE